MSLDRLEVPIRSNTERVATACLELAGAHAREEGGNPGAERRTKLNEVTRRAQVELKSTLTVLRWLIARERSDEHDGHHELVVRAAPNGNRVTWWTIARRTRDGKPVVALDEWPALPIRTKIGQHLLASVRKSGLLGTAEDGSADAGGGESGESSREP